MGEGEGDVCDVRGTAKCASEDGEGGMRMGLRFGKSVGENGGEVMKKLRLLGVVVGGGKVLSRLRMVWESGTSAGKKSASANATTSYVVSLVCVVLLLGFRLFVLSWVLK